MNKNTYAALAAACLLAFTAAPIHVTAGPAAYDHCIAQDDDPGFGGTTVDCGEPLPCGAYAELLIAAVSGDTEWGIPTVWGAYTCGGVTADCVMSKQACEGASGEPTDNTGKGDCWAESDEANNSPLTVACAVLGGVSDPPPVPTETICDIYPDFPDCDDNGLQIGSLPLPPLPPGPPLPPVVDHIRSLCESAAEKAGAILTPREYDDLFPVHFDVGKPIDGLSATITYPDGSVVSFLYQGDTCEADTRLQ